MKCIHIFYENKSMLSSSCTTPCLYWI